MLGHRLPLAPLQRHLEAHTRRGQFCKVRSRYATSQQGAGERSDRSTRVGIHSRPSGSETRSSTARLTAGVAELLWPLATSAMTRARSLADIILLLVLVHGK